MPIYVPTGPHQPQLTVDEFLALVLKHKGPVLAATAWEGFCQAGRGLVFTNGLTDVVYAPRVVVQREIPMPTSRRRFLLQQIAAYEPHTQIVLVIPWSDQPWTIRRITTTPQPEAAFLQCVGTPDCPPLRIHSPI